MLVALAAVSSARAQEEEAEDDELRRGLIATYAARDFPAETATRVDRTLAFDWGPRPPDPRLSQGPFSGQWRGYLLTPGPGKYRLSAHAAGQVAITLAGQRVLEAASDTPQWLEAKPIELPYGWHPVEIDYASQGAASRLALFWSGPQFSLEPISGRQLYHDPEDSPPAAFERGESLAAALRCLACHATEAAPEPSAAPALDRLAGQVSRSWLVEWLRADGAQGATLGDAARRMPHYGLSAEDAAAVAAYLLAPRATAEQASRGAQAPAPANKPSSPPAPAKSNPKQPKPTAAEGERLFATLGCLACHRVGELGESGLFGGGDLSRIAEKRPPAFFERWLADPASLNRDHRMPVFELTAVERQSLSLYLATLGEKQPPREDEPATDDATLADKGRRLVEANRCGACHTLPPDVARPVAPVAAITAQSRWDRSCLHAPHAAQQPRYPLPEQDAEAIQEYLSATSRLAKSAPSATEARLVLRERNCLACHARDDSAGLAAKLPSVIAAHTDLAPLLPAMTPPPLTSVGDKLHDQALVEAIRRTGGVHRPWLEVRMPKFNLSDEELQALTRQWVAEDRIPPHPSLAPQAPEATTALEAAGGRLVTTDGFGCVSCHRVGSVEPDKAPLNARGPDLTMLSRRIRHEWFERWVRNPARIVPRMEMPAVQLPVRGVLNDDLDTQLAAVWRALNTAGFEPPPPNPVRVLRRAGVREHDEWAVLGTDVLYDRGREYLKPLLIGLPNRHNVLFDLAENRLAGWWLGDAARQRTKGKTWFWESGGDAYSHLLHQVPAGSEITLEVDGQRREPLAAGQFPTELDAWRHAHGGLVWRQRLRFAGASPDAAPAVLRVEQALSPIWPDKQAAPGGFRRTVTISGAPANAKVVFRLLAENEKDWRAAAALPGRGTWEFTTADGSVIRVISPESAVIDKSGVVLSSAKDGPVKLELEYLSPRRPDTYPLASPSLPVAEPTPLFVAPGFQAVQLPVTEEIMPTALAWTPDGTLVVASLKGRVWLARDTDGDGLEDRTTPFSDDLAAPYGLATGQGYVDVANKYAVLRLSDADGDGRAEQTTTVASGWGHTTDYHDWAVGLPRDEQGNYYLALPCQQDDRSAAAAHLRGKLLRLVPRQPTDDDPQRFALEEMTAGHRFPMGIARRRDGEIFVTDNQGNYNPFNELNHVVPGQWYGFINKLEQKRTSHPPLTPPAIDLPHPWTRSVNGICFLETPRALREKLGRDAFGPFEGHLIGCEINNRLLVRMSLHRVGDGLQGAVYPLTYGQPKEGPALLGPLCAEVSPAGDLYVGSLLDSGWGGGNNIGAVVRMRPVPEELPAGIREVRAEPRGLVVEFTRPVSRDRAADAKNYALASYTRISTPAYGGDDVNRRTEDVQAIEAAPDGRSVVLRLKEWREGYVYELHVKNLASGQEEFFPAEAHYTLRRAPR